MSGEIFRIAVLAGLARLPGSAYARDACFRFSSWVSRPVLRVYVHLSSSLFVRKRIL